MKIVFHTAKLAPISPIPNLSPAPNDASPTTATKTTSNTNVSLKSDEDDDVNSSVKIETVRNYAEIIHDEPHHESTDESEHCAEYSSSKLSTLPVALVVEQTARILEDIKKKIQLQKEEEKLRRDEEEKDLIVKSPTLNSSTSSIPNAAKYTREASEERTFSASSTKSFIILSNSRYGDVMTPSRVATSTNSTKNPATSSTIPRSLSPDSGTDFSLPFSASSSISPPFLKLDEKGNNNLVNRSNPHVDYTMKFPHNASDNEIFKSLTSYTSSYASSSVIYATPKYTAISPTSPLSSKRRLSGITIPQYTTTTSLAKSTPSISADLISESQATSYILNKPSNDAVHQYHNVHPNDHFPHQQNQQHHQPHQRHVRPLSFQVLQSAADFTYETYHSTSLDYASAKTRYKSLANLPTSSITTTSITLRPSIASTVASNLNSRTSQLGSLLNGNARQAFGNDPLHMRPISSALEYPSSNFHMPNFQIQSIDTLHSLNLEKTANFEKSSTKSFDESLIVPRFEHLSRNLEKGSRPATAIDDDTTGQSQTDYFLSLSLSPPINRRTKNILMLKGIGQSM